jgi:hypothetical protein
MNLQPPQTSTPDFFQFLNYCSIRTQPSLSSSFPPLRPNTWRIHGPSSLLNNRMLPREANQRSSIEHDRDPTWWSSSTWIMREERNSRVEDLLGCLAACGTAPYLIMDEFTSVSFDKSLTRFPPASGSNFRPQREAGIWTSNMYAFIKPPLSSQHRTIYWPGMVFSSVILNWPDCRTASVDGGGVMNPGSWVVSNSVRCGLVVKLKVEG